ncbi:MAG TPA: ArsR family transcriptional regulator [Aigarchaeota archaeon]|nr:ArsR family transcriptional regulator [Aigarchaeota archaeon]
MKLEDIPKKEGIIKMDNIMYVIGSRSIARVASALANDTRARILSIIAREKIADLDRIADEIKQSKANISSQIRKLENVGIVSATYKPGERGIKKLIELKVDAIIFVMRKDNEQVGSPKVEETTGS